MIGAGPGDPELITVKGLRALRACGAVIYDYLTPFELIMTLDANVAKYYVGKRSGKHTVSQEDINKLMVKLARAGQIVGRLKGGDPFIFGRGGEEAVYLKKSKIKFEIIPGITAGIAAPAAAGIPCTDRKLSSHVTFATGHKAKNKVANSVQWEALAKAESGTLVIYMGVAEMPGIIARLIDGGLSPDTPAAIIERGTLPSQRFLIASLSDIYQKARGENIKPPALLVVGEVVKLHRKLSQPKTLPLLGRRIMVTRAADQAQKIYTQLRALGAEVLPYPTIATKENHDARTWYKFTALLAGDGNRLGWLVFTSENGVRYFMNRLNKFRNDLRSLARFKIAAIGYGTAAALGKYHMKPDFMPAKATIASLALEMTKKLDLKNNLIVRVRGNLGDNRIEQSLRSAGARVLPIKVYKTYSPDWPDGFKQKLFDYPPDTIIFTSGSSAEGLFKILNRAEVKILLKNAIVASIGQATSSVLKSYKLRVAVQAKKHNIPGLIEELVKYYRKKRS